MSKHNFRQGLLFDWLKKNGPATVARMVSEVGLTKSKVRRAMYRLEERGYVKVHDHRECITWKVSYRGPVNDLRGQSQGSRKALEEGHKNWHKTLPKANKARGVECALSAKKDLETVRQSSREGASSEIPSLSWADLLR